MSSIVCGAMGQAGMAMALVPPANFQSAESRLKPEWEMLSIISYGIIFSPMHGWQDRLSDENMLDVLSYIRHLAFLGSVT